MTPKRVRASGISGPLSHVATEARTGICQELLDRLLHVTTEFFTAAKKQQRICVSGVPPHLGKVLLRTQDMILSQYRVRRDEQTERVCAVYASMTPIRRDKHNSPARTTVTHRTCPHPHVRHTARAHTHTRPRAHARPDVRRHQHYVPFYDTRTPALPNSKVQGLFCKRFLDI